MYYLKLKNGSKVFYLFENKEYIVGRRDCNILISDDSSISRRHASILTENKKIKLTDFGAKYKTFVNNVVLQPNTSTDININDEIKFGKLNSVYSIEESKLSVTTSGLTIDEKKELSTIIEKLGGSILSQWSKDCSYLIVRELMLTVKILCALIDGQPMVTIKFWKDFLTAATKSLPLPKPDNYKPKLSETILNKNINFNYLPQRKTLFKDKVFILQTKASKAKIQSVIELAGGSSVQWNEKQFTKEIFSSENSTHLLIQDDSVAENENNSFAKMITYLYSVGKRPIPFQEIAVAVVLASCERDCNPKFKRTGTSIRQDEILYTQNIMQSNTEDTMNTVNMTNTGNILANQIKTQVHDTDDNEGFVIPESFESVEVKRSEQLQITNITNTENRTLVDEIRNNNEFVIPESFESIGVKRSAEQLNSNAKRIRIKDSLQTKSNINNENKPSTSSERNKPVPLPFKEMSQNSEDTDIKPLEELDEVLNDTQELELFKTQVALKIAKQKEVNSSVKRTRTETAKEAKKTRLNEGEINETLHDIFTDTVSARELVDNAEIVTSTQVNNNLQDTAISSVTEKSLNPFLVRCGPKLDTKKSTAKISDFFKPSKQTEDRIADISAVNAEVPSTSGIKRRSDDMSPERNAKRSQMVKNPFSLIKQPTAKPRSQNIFQNPFSNLCKPTAKPRTSNENPFSRPTRRITKIKEDATISVNQETPERLTFSVTVVDSNMERNYSWLSKNTIIKEEFDNSSKENVTETDEMERFAESFKNCIVIETKDLVMRRESPRNHNESSFTNKKDFKKFRKVQPCRMQTTIISRNSYVDVVCGNESENS